MESTGNGRAVRVTYDVYDRLRQEQALAAQRGQRVSINQVVRWLVGLDDRDTEAPQANGTATPAGH
jgi:hypothetical protein